MSKRLLKHTRAWVFLTHPLGYDPYASIDSSYMVNTQQHELMKIKSDIADAFIGVAREHTDVAAIYKNTATVDPFE